MTPTLRECRDIINLVADTFAWKTYRAGTAEEIISRQVKRIDDRLTPEALERDEKRSKNKDLIVQAIRDGKYSVAEMWLDCLDNDHPLPPDQEKE